MRRVFLLLGFLLLGVVVIGAAPLTARAQEAAQAIRSAGGADGGCFYAECALGIAPVWNGLDVVRGAGAVRVGRLGFFWPGEVRPLFAGNDSATAYADRAVRARRVGALLTDLGGVLLGTVALRMARDGGARGSTPALALGGMAAFGLGVPFQFAADGHLARAVWWRNATARP